jgi:Flp pilus assembly pilin Flp
MQKTIALLRGFVREDDGQDLVEYGLLAVLICVVAIGAVATLGQTINTAFWQVIANKF